MELSIFRCVHCERVTVLEINDPMAECPCGAEFYPMSRKLILGEPVSLAQIAGEPLEGLIESVRIEDDSQLPSFEEKKAQLESLYNSTVAEFLARVSEAIRGSDKLRITISTDGVPRHAVDVVIGELAKKGWSAKYVPDQRDGNYLDIIEGVRTP